MQLELSNVTTPETDGYHAATKLAQDHPEWLALLRVSDAEAGWR
jgi:hypothetical protein